MVEYTVETLVHLYDSLNSQVEKAQCALADGYKYEFNPMDEDSRKEYNKTMKALEARIDKLVKMRDNTEELLNRILKIEVTEA